MGFGVCWRLLYRERRVGVQRAEILTCATKFVLLDTDARRALIRLAAFEGDQLFFLLEGTALPKMPSGLIAKLTELGVCRAGLENRSDRFRVDREIRELTARWFYGRRHYAGIALRALLERCADRSLEFAAGETTSGITKAAFKWADAMLAAEEE